MGNQDLIKTGEEIKVFIHSIPSYIKDKSLNNYDARNNLIKYNIWKEQVLELVGKKAPSKFRDFQTLFSDVERDHNVFSFSQIIGKLYVILNNIEQSDDISGIPITDGNKGKLKITKSSDETGEEIDVEGLTDGHIHIYNQQFQHQAVFIDVFVQSIKSELSDEQIKQLTEIINSNSDSKSKKKSIFDKLLSFGSDVAANILAELITKPEIFGVFFPGS